MPLVIKWMNFFFFFYGMRGLFMRQEQLYLMGPGFYNADKMCAS